MTVVIVFYLLFIIIFGVVTVYGFCEGYGILNIWTMLITGVLIIGLILQIFECNYKLDSVNRYLEEYNTLIDNIDNIENLNGLEIININERINKYNKFIADKNFYNSIIVKVIYPQQYEILMNLKPITYLK